MCGAARLFGQRCLRSVDVNYFVDKLFFRQQLEKVSSYLVYDFVIETWTMRDLPFTTFIEQEGQDVRREYTQGILNAIRDIRESDH